REGNITALIGLDSVRSTKSVEKALIERVIGARPFDIGATATIGGEGHPNVDIFVANETGTGKVKDIGIAGGNIQRRTGTVPRFALDGDRRLGLIHNGLPKPQFVDDPDPLTDLVTKGATPRLFDGAVLGVPNK